MTTRRGEITTFMVAHFQDILHLHRLDDVKVVIVGDGGNTPKSLLQKHTKRILILIIV